MEFPQKVQSLLGFFVHVVCMLMESLKEFLPFLIVLRYLELTALCTRVLRINGTRQHDYNKLLLYLVGLLNPGIRLRYECESAKIIHLKRLLRYF